MSQILEQAASCTFVCKLSNTPLNISDEEVLARLRSRYATTHRVCNTPVFSTFSTCVTTSLTGSIGGLQEMKTTGEHAKSIIDHDVDRATELDCDIPQGVSVRQLAGAGERKKKWCKMALRSDAIRSVSSPNLSSLRGRFIPAISLATCASRSSSVRTVSPSWAAFEIPSLSLALPSDSLGQICSASWMGVLRTSTEDFFFG